MKMVLVVSLILATATSVSLSITSLAVCANFFILSKLFWMILRLSERIVDVAVDVGGAVAGDVAWLVICVALLESHRNIVIP